MKCLVSSESSNLYIIIEANGGLNQQRSSVRDLYIVNQQIFYFGFTFLQSVRWSLHATIIFA